MNYRSFQITPKHIIFISLIGIVLILLVIKASWYSHEGLDTILDTLKRQGIDTIPKKLAQANLIKENLYRNQLKPDDPQANINLKTAIIENKLNSGKLTKEGRDKLLALFETQSTDSKKMSDHIDFVETIYEKVKHPFNYIMNAVSTSNYAITEE